MTIFLRVFYALALIQFVGAMLPQAKAANAVPGKTFRDCSDCPEMMVVSAGHFVMGSPVSDKDHKPAEAPQHDVTLKSFALGKFEVTRDQFARFVKETKYDATSGGCDGLRGFSDYHANPTDNWTSPGWPQEGNHPVVCMSFNDAMAYVNWLAKKTGKPYRLASESEWEYAYRAGSTTAYWFGDDVNTGCERENGADLDAKKIFPDWQTSTCHDGHPISASVGSYKPNAFGLYDMAGNAWELVADCRHENYVGAPADGTAWVTDVKPGDCKSHVRRGGSWDHFTWITRAATRLGDTAEYRKANTGFRIARDL